MFVCFGGEEVFIADFDLNSSQWKNTNSATKGLIPGYSSYNFTMRLFYLLWLFFLLLNVDKSFQQIACPTLPDVPHAHVSEETKRAEYQGGHVIHFTCEPGYKKSGPNIKYVCTSEGWLAVEQGTCSQIACEVGVMPPHVDAVGLPPGTNTVTAGYKLQFECDNRRPVDGPAEIECLKTGEWSAGYPTCDDKCTLKDVSNTVRMTPRALPNNQLSKGQTLRFACTNSRDSLLGEAEVECLAHGQWSHDFPTCGDALTCGKPPYLEDGDVTTSSNTEYSHGETVEYSCQNYYTMQGGPYKTCNNGEWTGLITCLKPCTVNKYIMASNNIRLKYLQKEKLYSAHNDFTVFTCTRGRPVGTVEMRQRCVNGQMNFPTCE
ncbi:complement factor H-like isoform X2 [Centropristis striata]|uniref:complement factor H-like isoform X2 n=1 Tax=Centropristis striata TaxID=184440 RepID=UPI0027E0DDFA|nr:complement factor H-like isoform X2 [Centropristis striata]